MPAVFAEFETANLTHGTESDLNPKHLFRSFSLSDMAETYRRSADDLTVCDQRLQQSPRVRRLENGAAHASNTNVESWIVAWYV
jgi:hypothetical protein